MIKERTHEPVVSRAVFEQARALSPQDARAPDQSATVHTVSGFTRCADCRKSMQRSHARGMVYLVCRTNSEKAKCSRHAIREDILENAVLLSIQKQIALFDQLAGMLGAIQREPAATSPLQRHETALSDRRQACDQIRLAFLETRSTFLIFLA